MRGVEPARILAQYMGRAGGITAGRDGNVHFGDRDPGCVGMVSMLPDMMLVATGMAMAFKLRGEPRCALTWFGDGSTSRGDFHEAMNWAGVQRLPVIFVLENNQYAYSTPVAQQFAVDPVERAAAYGFPGVTVDGNDVEAMFEATRAARERALDGGGPTLIEAVTMRMHGHAAHDDMRYVPEELVAAWRERDPIELQQRRLAELGVDVEALRAGVAAEVRRPPRRRSRCRCPTRPPLRRVSSARAKPSRWVTAPHRGADSRTPSEGGDGMGELTYLEAISDGLREEMRADERVFVMGEDVGDVRRRVQGDRRLRRGVRARSGDGHAAGRVGHRRHRHRRRRGRHAAGLRDAVLGLHRLRLRPARQRRGQDALPPGLAVPLTVRLPSGAASPAGRSTPRTRRRGSCTRPG